ncbi:MAG: hypothetical protein QXR45_14805 [Candidatus Bathyarchaeia archaeon]
MSLILLIAILALNMMETATAVAEVAITANISLGGIRWIGKSNSTVIVTTSLGYVEKSEEVVLASGETIRVSLNFEHFTTPTNLTVAIINDDNQIFTLEGSMQQNSIRITRAFYDEKFLTPNDGESLLEITFIGRFYTIELLLPIRGNINVECSVDALPADAKVRDVPNGTLVAVENLMFLSENSTFTLIIHQNSSLISSIRGLMSGSGLQSISIDGGIIERIKAKAIVTTGSQRAVIPSSILKSVPAEETLRVDKIIELSVISTQIVRGNMPVRLLAFNKGSWFQSSNIISHAFFEISLPRLNITKLYGNNETAYLPTNERVIIKAMAEGYISQSKTLTISSDMKEIVFYLEFEKPSLLGLLEKMLISIILHQLFVPAVLGIIAAIIIILVIRRG